MNDAPTPIQILVCLAVALPVAVATFGLRGIAVVVLGGAWAWLESK